VTTFLLILGAFVLAIWTSRHYALHRAYRDEPFVRADASAGPPEPAPRISVLIPARNEARNIRRCLDALLAQNYPHFEVIVIDDRSGDETVRIVREVGEKNPRVRLLISEPLPDGWTGKNHALHQASRAASGELLLFLDADVALDPGALVAMVRRMTDDNVDMLSMLIRLDSRNFWEKAVRVLAGAILTVRYPFRKVNDPKLPHAFANGQIIMVRTDVYRELGGHERVRAILLEDVALAHLVKESGRRLMVAYGFDAAAARMYSSFGELWRGWSRIYYSGFRGSVPKLLLHTLALVVFSLSPYVSLAWAAALLATGRTGPAAQALLALAALEVLVMDWLMVRLHRVSRCEGRYAALNWLAVLVCLGIMISAIRRCFTSGVIVWRDTSYDVNGGNQKTSGGPRR
jgi:cellulose synthase/poly-beta-1,6-N-acetylglucosamine synthase-like glycosyltransferase